MSKTTIPPLEFEWDEGNREKNWLKHQVTVKESEEIFFDKNIQSIKSNKQYPGETRYIAFGETMKSRPLMVVFTVRKNKIRVISVRDQNKDERRKYGKQETKNDS